MTPETGESPLPYTPSNTGRRAKVGYLGFDGVGFNDLWPIFAGLVLSIVLALKFFVVNSGGAAHWLSRTIEALFPFCAGYAYLRVLVMGRPPHFKGDIWATLLDVRLDFTDPPWRVIPILPRIVFDSTAACGPARAGDQRRRAGGKKN
jgi:hypothetical protein